MLPGHVGERRGERRGQRHALDRCRHRAPEPGPAVAHPEPEPRRKRDGEVAGLGRPDRDLPPLVAAGHQPPRCGDDAAAHVEERNLLPAAKRHRALHAAVAQLVRRDVKVKLEGERPLPVVALGKPLEARGDACALDDPARALVGERGVHPGVRHAADGPAVEREAVRGDLHRGVRAVFGHERVLEDELGRIAPARVGGASLGAAPEPQRHRRRPVRGLDRHRLVEGDGHLHRLARRPLAVRARLADPRLAARARHARLRDRRAAHREHEGRAPLPRPARVPAPGLRGRPSARPRGNTSPALFPRRLDGKTFVLCWVCCTPPGARPPGRTGSRAKARCPPAR